jgi:membrane protein
VGALQRVRAAVVTTSGRVRRLALQVLDTVPPVRRSVDDLVRVEVIDRSMVVAAQGLLALIPLVVVLAAFLPADLTSAGVERFQEVTGLTHANVEQVTRQVEPLKTGSELRAETGFVGLLITVLSASSFARAVMRAYERVWGLPSVSGMRGRRRALGWLLGWLVGLQIVSLVGWATDRWSGLGTGVVSGAARVVLQVVLLTLLWCWTFRVLLTSRVGWGRLWAPALLTGVALAAYMAGSAVVMPTYATSSAEQFGTFGLVLAVAAWLVGFGGVLVVAAVVGRVLAEDPFTRRVAGGAVARLARPRDGGATTDASRRSDGRRGSPWGRARGGRLVLGAQPERGRHGHEPDDEEPGAEHDDEDAERGGGVHQQEAADEQGHGTHAEVPGPSSGGGGEDRAHDVHDS